MMKKYAVPLLCILLICGCANQKIDKNQITQSKEKPERIIAIYKGLAEDEEIINNQSAIAIWAYYPDKSKELITDGWKVEEPVTLRAGKTSEVTVVYQGLKSTINVECSKTDEDAFKQECQSPDESDLVVTHSQWHGKKLTYSGKIIARIDDKKDDYRAYIVKIFDDLEVCVLDLDKQFDFKKGDYITFWGYGLGKSETKGFFKSSIIGFKAKYMELT